jgi:hypothetical protein
MALYRHWKKPTKSKNQGRTEVLYIPSSIHLGKKVATHTVQVYGKGRKAECKILSDCLFFVQQYCHHGQVQQSHAGLGLRLHSAHKRHFNQSRRWRIVTFIVGNYVWPYAGGSSNNNRKAWSTLITDFVPWAKPYMAGGRMLHLWTMYTWTLLLGSSIPWILRPDPWPMCPGTG